MRFRTTLILLILAAGLGVYLWFVERPKIEEEAKKKTLFEFKADDVNEVDLVYQDKEIVLKKSGDDWRLSKPIEVAGDNVSIKNLVNAIAECEVKKELTETSSDLAQYGLDKPLVTATVKLKDKSLPAFSVGKNTPVGFSTYVQRSDDKKIYLTNSAFRSGLDKQVKDLRDKTIVTFADADVQKIDLHGPKGNVLLVRKDDVWSLEQPGPFAADQQTVRSFLSTMRSARAVDFPDDHPTDLSKYGLDQPRLKATLYLGKDNTEKSLIVGNETPEKKNELYAQATGLPSVYTVNDWVMRDLGKDAGEFRDKTLLAFDRPKLTAVEVTRADGTKFKLAGSDKDGWHVDGNDGKVSPTTVSGFIGDLHDLKGFEIAADNPTDLSVYGLDKPLLSATLLGEESKPIGTVLIGEHKNDQGSKEYFSMRAGGPTVFKIRDYLITRLNKQPQDFIEVPTPTVGAGTPAAAPAAAPAAEEPEDEPLQDENDE